MAKEGAKDPRKQGGPRPPIVKGPGWSPNPERKKDRSRVRGYRCRSLERPSAEAGNQA